MYIERGNIVLTFYGKAEKMLVEDGESQRMYETLAMKELLLNAEDDIINDRITDAEAFFREFRRDQSFTSEKQPSTMTP